MKRVVMVTVLGGMTLFAGAVSASENYVGCSLRKISLDGSEGLEIKIPGATETSIERTAYIHSSREAALRTDLAISSEEFVRFAFKVTDDQWKETKGPKIGTLGLTFRLRKAAASDQDDYEVTYSLNDGAPSYRSIASGLFGIGKTQIHSRAEFSTPNGMRLEMRCFWYDASTAQSFDLL